MDIHPIKTVKDHDAAVARIDVLMNKSDLTSDEDDELDILAALVNAWEEENVPIAPPHPVEAILFRMDQMGYG